MHKHELQPGYVIAALEGHLRSADQLIEVAVTSVDSFFVDWSAREPGGEQFAGFLRDSEIRGTPHHTTGGLYVAACLLQMEPYFDFLRENVSGLPVKELLSHTQLCRQDLLANSHAQVPGGFGAFNALTSAHCAFLASGEFSGGNSVRSGLFLSAALTAFSGGRWPTVSDADEPHPFVAYCLLRAARRAARCSDTNSHLAAFVSTIPPNYVKVRGFGEPELNATIERIRGRLGQNFQLKEAVDESVASYRETAEEYLWSQCGHAPRREAAGTDPARYDPAGACFALNILLDCYLHQHGPTAVLKLLGEHSGLLAATTQHVLASATHSGLLPYGLPFSYDARGSGMFATSVSGLAAFAMFWSKCLYLARKRNYPSRSFLRTLLLESGNLLDTLYRVIPLLAGSVRSQGASNESLLGREFSGWATDRSPTRRRVESWVSVDVLQFGVYVRELVQELAELIILEELGGTWPTDAPTWPYTREGAYLGCEVDVYQDPDLSLDCGSPTRQLLTRADPEAPVQFIHHAFKDLIPEGGFEEPHSRVSWRQDISSVILFGPPGTSKTTLVRSLAKALRWHSVELNPGQFIVGGRERLEERATAIFNQIGLLRECVVLLDELDSIFIDRARVQAGDIINFIVPAMLPKLQRLARRLKTQRSLLVIATNFYDRLDPALLRKGRVDKHLLMLPYNRAARERVLDRCCAKYGVDWSSIPSDQMKWLVEQTALMTFEEILDVAQKIGANRSEMQTTGQAAWMPRPAISGSLYGFRISALPDGDSLPLLRLLSEVCGVAERRLELPRGPVHQHLGDLDARAKRIDGELRGDRDWSPVVKQARERLERSGQDTQGGVRSGKSRSWRLWSLG